MNIGMSHGAGYQIKGLILKTGFVTQDTASKVVAFLFDNLLFRTIVAWVLVLFTTLFGLNSTGYLALFILITLDIMTGLWKSGKKKRTKSVHLRNGTVKKVIFYAVFMISVHQITKVGAESFPVGAEWLIFLDKWAILFLCVTELISIVENLHELGFLIPKWLSKRLHKILDQDPFE